MSEERKIEYGPWEDFRSNSVRRAKTRHVANVWHSAQFRWCGEARVYGISNKGSWTREDAKEALDLALRQNGAVLIDEESP